MLAARHLPRRSDGLPRPFATVELVDHAAESAARLDEDAVPAPPLSSYRTRLLRGAAPKFDETAVFEAPDGRPWSELALRVQCADRWPLFDKRFGGSVLVGLSRFRAATGAETHWWQPLDEDPTRLDGRHFAGALTVRPADSLGTRPALHLAVRFTTTDETRHSVRYGPRHSEVLVPRGEIADAELRPAPRFAGDDGGAAEPEGFAARDRARHVWSHKKTLVLSRRDPMRRDELTLLRGALRDASDPAARLAQDPPIERLALRMDVPPSPPGDYVALFAAVAASRHLTSLDVSGMPLGAEGAAALASAIRGPVPLRVLVADGTRLGDAGAASLAGALVAASDSLRELALRRSDIGPRGAIALADALAAPPSAPCRLERLALSGNAIEPAGAAAIGTALRHTAYLSKLEMAGCRVVQWSVARNAPDLSGLQGLGNGVRRSVALAEIDLADNGLVGLDGRGAGRHVVSGLFEFIAAVGANAGILKIDLRRNRGVVPEAARLQLKTSNCLPAVGRVLLV